MASYSSASGKTVRYEEYIVRDPKETLESIAVAHKASVALIRKNNRATLSASNNKVYVGMKIMLPVTADSLDFDGAALERIVSAAPLSLPLPVQHVAVCAQPTAPQENLSSDVSPSVGVSPARRGSCNERILEPSRPSSKAFPLTDTRDTDGISGSPPSISMSVSPIIALTAGFINSFYGQSTSSRQADMPADMESNSEPDFPSSSSSSQHAEYIPKLIGDGQILTPGMMQQLLGQLPHSLQLSDWVLRYSLLGHGTDLITFYRNTAKTHSTVILIQTLTGDVFGGFSNTPWRPSLSFYGSGESFVFKANRQGGVVVYPWTGMNDFFMWSTEDKLAMGGGGDGFAFVLDNNFIGGETCRSATYGNPPLDSSPENKKGGSSFKIANIEAWSFRPLA